MNEQAIQAKIIKGLEARNFYVVKTMVTNRAGVPDILACSPEGRFVAIEVKRPGGVLSKLQEVHLRKIHERQGISFVAHSLEEVLRELKDRAILSTHSN